MTTGPRAARAALLAVVALTALACGSRSELASTAATGTGGSSGADGGSGGASGACAPWDQTAWFTFPAFGETGAEQPRLAAIDQAEQTVVLGTIGFGLATPIRYFHASVDPWIAPANTNLPLSGDFLYDLEHRAFRLGRSRVDDVYALLLSVTVPPGALLDPEVTPGAAEPGIEQPFPSAEPGEILPRFVAYRAQGLAPEGDYLIGIQRRVGVRRRLLVRLVSGGWGGIEHGQALACADRDLAADVAAVGSLFYAAVASSRALGQCDDANDAFAAPTRLGIVAYNQPVGTVLTPVYETVAGGEIGGIQLLADESGLWVLAAEQSAPEASSLSALRIELGNSAVSGPFPIATLEWPPVFSAARRGDALVVASLERTASGQRIVPVRTVTASGGVESTVLVVPEAAGGVAIVAAPTGNAFLLALTRESVGASQPAISLSRYGCP